MASLPKLVTNKSLKQAVGAMQPLAQVSSVVQTLSNIQGFNPGQFSQLTNSIQGALQGFSEASNILSNFGGSSAYEAFSNSLQSTGMAGSSVEAAAQAGGQAYSSSFLSTQQQASSFAKLKARRDSVENTRIQNRVSSHQFPRDIGKYWIALTFKEASFSSLVGGSSGNPVTQKTSGSVVLPVPINLTDSNKLEYTAIKLSDAVTGPIQDIAGGILRGMGSGEGASMGSKIGALGISSIMSHGWDAMSASTGIAINTHQTLKFVQPSLKQHAFTWKLIPSSPQEAQDLKNIINFIKNKIYPKSTRGGLTFDYPNLVDVYLYNADTMYKFKPAFVESFTVNYTPDGNPAFYRDKHPVAVQIDMQIHENSVWLNGEF